MLRCLFLLNSHKTRDRLATVQSMLAPLVMSQWPSRSERATVEKKNSIVEKRFIFSCNEFMASTQGVFGQVIHFVYTWLPKTTGSYKRKRKDFRQSKKPENISQKTSSPMLAFMRSSQGLPSTPNASKVLILRALPNTCKGQEELPEDLSSCNLQVVGYKFLSYEKKMSKRSALKKWLRRKANDVFPRNIYCDGQFGNSRHILCSRELFECSLKLDGKSLVNFLNRKRILHVEKF